MRDRTNPRKAAWFAGLFWLCLFYIVILFFREGSFAEMDSRAMTYFIAAIVMALVGSLQQTIVAVRGFKQKRESLEE